MSKRIVKCNERIPIVAVLIATAMILGCTTPWEQARQTNTTQAYRSFIQANPKSRDLSKANDALDRYIGQARRAIRKLDWQATQQSDSVESYRDFLEKYPSGQFHRSARKAYEASLYKRATK